MIRNHWLGTAAILAASGLAALAWVPVATAGGEACRAAADRAKVGPPLICHPIQIGDAQSLPFGAEAFEVDKGYNVKHVVGDTLRLIKTEKSALVRMETLRRATVYVRGNEGAATELLGKLAWKALDAEAQAEQNSAGDWRAGAWFDAGYFAACLAQLNIDVDWNAGVADGVIGYAWIKEALRLSKEDPEMEFAGALVTHPAMRDSKRDLFERHLRACAPGLQGDALLAKNVKAHLANWGESIDQIVAHGK